jgi:hypothetical protein
MLLAIKLLGASIFLTLNKHCISNHEHYLALVLQQFLDGLPEYACFISGVLLDGRLSFFF